MLSSMENFTIKEQIGKAAQATVYIVERQQDKQKFVLKKVECFDESEANKAFKEAANLRDLQHVYLSGYNEFFVLWEKEDSSVYLCILMDYFPKGTLENVLEKCREKKEVMDEERVKQWIGQIVEALVYIHKKKVIHRDVRPSNIYLQEDDNLVLGDLGVATIMGDAITCTRASPSSMKYMGPEVASLGYSEKSDVWSLGCIVFELVTTWLYDATEAIDKLKQVRDEPRVLDEVFEDIAKHYSDALISTLAAMLKVNSTQRCTAVGLLGLPFIRQCVEMSDSSQLEKRKRLKSASTTQSQIRPVPRDEGVVRVLEYLANMVDYEVCVKDALNYLLQLAKMDEPLQLDARGKKLVAMAMKNNMVDRDVQIAGCNLLGNLVMAAESGDVMFSPEVIAVIPLAMETHPADVDVQYAAASLLMTLAANNAAGSLIGQLGGVQNILTALKTHPHNARLCSTCLNALWALTIYGSNVKIVTDWAGIKEVCTVLKLHLNSPELAEAACASVLALSLDEENLELICELDVVGLLVAAISNHPTNAKVVKNACLALASLVEVDEESAYRVLTNEGPDNTHIAGVPIVMKTYELHKDNAEVVESIVTLLMELASYDDVKAEMNHLNIGPGLLSEIFKRFKENMDIMGPCDKALERLRGGKPAPRGGSQLHDQPPAQTAAEA